MPSVVWVLKLFTLPHEACWEEQHLIRSCGLATPHAWHRACTRLVAGPRPSAARAAAARPLCPEHRRSGTADSDRPPMCGCASYVVWVVSLQRHRSAQPAFAAGRQASRHVREPALPWGQTDPASVSLPDHGHAASKGHGLTATLVSTTTLWTSYGAAVRLSWPRQGRGPDATAALAGAQPFSRNPPPDRASKRHLRGLGAAVGQHGQGRPPMSYPEPGSRKAGPQPEERHSRPSAVLAKAMVPARMAQTGSGTAPARPETRYDQLEHSSQRHALCRLHEQADAPQTCQLAYARQLPNTCRLTGV